MAADRSWMYRRISEDKGITDEFRSGLREFVQFAIQNSADSQNFIRCPCKECRNRKWLEVDMVQLHLRRRGFLEGYTRWTFHGEEDERTVLDHDLNSSTRENYDPVEMLMDAAGPSILEDSHADVETNVGPQGPNGEATRFYQLLDDASVPLYPGVENGITKLVAVTKLLHLKNRTGCSERNFDGLLTTVGSFLPHNHTLPSTYYEVKKMVRGLNLGYEKIHACPKDCMLFYGDDKDKVVCNICKTSRYVDKYNPDGRNIPRKILRYFPLGPRLQRLFMSSKTAGSMTWHHNRKIVDGQLTHPSDGDEWKRFDQFYPEFAAEPRNVRLGLATDGFSPFSNIYAKQYSVWPVIMVVYNLPPSMCMKDPYMFMSLLVPGPNSPTRDLNVYLKPLVDELKILWHTGIDTYDRTVEKNFTMKAALLWTINDFPAYGMVSGWSTHGKLSCPVCMGDVQGIRLKYGGKCSYFGTARRFLKENDPWRRNTVRFGRAAENRVVEGRKIGLLVSQSLSEMSLPQAGKDKPNEKAKGYGKQHNWTHFPCFFELSYWNTLALRHCIDVMHTEKNVFDNTLYTLLDTKGKTKDNEKTRLDLKEMNLRQELWMTNDGVKPKARFTLTPLQAKLVYEWLSKLKFPDGCTANISRCSKVSEMRIQGLKSHDCHVFMQKLLPVVFRELLPNNIVDTLTELSNFFRDICSNVLIYKDLEKLDTDIVKTMCKLESIFPPGYFDSMEHLPIHLAEECKLGGPVQFRWMYPFERFMRRLKLKVRNKARVEGSIAEQYTEQELTDFCSSYFDSDVTTVHNRLSRNEVVRPDNPNLLAAYTYPAKPFGQMTKRYLSNDELKRVSTYVLLNMPEVAPYIQEYENEISEFATTDAEVESLINNEFKTWFNNKIKGDPTKYALFKELIEGPIHFVWSYPSCIVNGYRFKCGDLSKPTSTNSGVMVKGSCYNDILGNYYGRLQEVWQLNYDAGYQVIVFKCHWFDTTRHTSIDKFGGVTVDVRSQLATEDVFVLASQATQVYYTPSVLHPRSSKFTVLTIKTHAFDESTRVVSEEAMQEDVSNAQTTPITNDGLHPEIIQYKETQDYNIDEEEEENGNDEEVEGLGDDDDDDDDGYDGI